VSDLEDRGVLVPVHGDDAAGFPHPRQMGHGPGDAAGDVEGRRHGTARQADLPPVFHPAPVADGPGAPHRRLGEEPRQAFDQRQIFGGADTLAGGDDDLRRGKIISRLPGGKLSQWPAAYVGDSGGSVEGGPGRSE